MSYITERPITEEEHTRCWHGTGVALESMPPQYPEVCCHCGEERVVRPQSPTTAGHGPFLPTGGSR